MHEIGEGSEHMRTKLEDSTNKSIVISGTPILVDNSNNVRKNYSKYSLPNTPMDQYVMSIRVEKKSRLTSIPIIFINEDEIEVNYPHDDTFVITIKNRFN